MFGAVLALLLAALATCLAGDGVRFGCVEDMVNWMNPGRSYGLHFGLPETGLPPSRTWILVLPPSEPTGDYNVLSMAYGDLLEEVEGLDLFSRGFTEIHLGLEAAESVLNRCNSALIRLMLLLRLGKHSVIRTPMLDGVDVAGFETSFATVQMHDSHESPYPYSQVTTLWIEFVGRRFIGKAGLPVA